MEFIIILAFIIGLLVCIFFDISIIVALIFGYILFFSYGLFKKYSVKKLLLLSIDGISKVKNILIVFVLIGMITALWRASGTIPVIIYTFSSFIKPSSFLLATFILNAAVSLLIGTSFGTAATLGVICMSIGNALGINPMLSGGAILSGIFVGDRSSPMSTSALLICELTKTDIFKNIKEMTKTSFVPIIATCLIYFLLGLTNKASSSDILILELFPKAFNMHIITFTPAIIIIVLSFLKINVKWTMLTSIIASIIICITIQNIDMKNLLQTIFTGYNVHDEKLAHMINGGGIFSMLKVGAIIFISASYSTIFEETQLLIRFKKYIALIAKKTNPFTSTLITSIGTTMIACNQTLAIMLTHQLSKDIIKNKQELAITLEDTVVVVAPLIPWSIAGATPLYTVSAPLDSIAFAFFLYLLPIWRLISIKLNKTSRRV